MTERTGVHKIWIVAVAVCAGLLLGALPATAATVTGPTGGLAVSAIEAGGTVDLTICLNPPNPNDDPDPDSLPPGPLAGTVFTVRQLQEIDLTTRIGWARARSITIREAERGPFGHVESATTDIAGKARFVDLPVGLYLVTSVPPDPFHDYPDSAPFLITLPTGGKGGWNYEPVVFAKPGSDVPPITITFPPIPPVWPTEGPPSGTAPPTAPPGASPTATAPQRTPQAGEDSPADSPSAGSEKRGSLAVTGAAVAVLAGAGLVLVGLGLLLRFLVRRRG